MSTVLVVNCGSSSVKLDVFLFPSEENPLSLLIERVGKDNARMKVHHHSVEERNVDAKTPAIAVGLALDEAAKRGYVPTAVGHRVVHGGEQFTDSVRISDDVVNAIKACVPLAPLHNPANLAGIEVARARLDVPHVAVFDTAFHQTLSPDAYLYALPRELYEQQKFRRYGFHGTSHRYVAERAEKFLGRPLRLVTLHLGNGCSACAIDRGRSVDTSMGLTPLEGLVMGTRCGDVDPAIVASLARTMGVEQAEELLNKKSGLLGLSKKSNDMRDLEQHASNGDSDADLAIRVFTRRIRKYVGAYAAVLGGLDAIVFTGGIGENSARVRREVCEGLGVMGALLDDNKNSAKSKDERDVASDDSRARILVIPTDEERVIARDALRLS
jgi:acetate kinase